MADAASRSAKYSSPSMLIRGSARSTGRGSHHAAFPNSDMIAGTARQRTTVASIAIATASPTPNCLTIAFPFRTKLANTKTMISAADVMTRPVLARPSRASR